MLEASALCQYPNNNIAEKNLGFYRPMLAHTEGGMRQ